MKPEQSVGHLTSEELKSEELLRHIVLDFRQMKQFIQHPLVMTSADGIRYKDIDGKEYIDGLSGVYVVNVGHNNRKIIEAMKVQMDNFVFAPPLHGTNSAAICLAKLLSEVSPGDLNTIKLLSGGSEVTEGAMKMARQYHAQAGHPRKYKVISLYTSYHGATMGALAATGSKRRKSVFEPLAEGFIHIHPHYCYRCPFGKEYPDCGITCAKIVEEIIDMEDPETIASMILEPIINTGGILTPPPEYLPLLRKITQKHNILLIFDEIITGFGRTGRMFGSETFGVTPDIICCGKGMSSGYAPLAAMLISDEVYQAFWGEPFENVEFSEGHTYGCHQIAAAAGIAAIEELLRRKLPESAQKVGGYLAQRLKELDEELGIFGEVRGKGLMVGVELVKDKKTKTKFDNALGKKVGEEAMERGLILRTEADWFSVAPPLITTREDIDEILMILRESLIAGLKRWKK